MTSPSSDHRDMRKIGFVGTFDIANYGDCLFPVVYMELLERHIPGVQFSFYSPLSRSAKIMNYGPIQALPDTIENTNFDEDAIILCGGETLWLGHSSGTFNFPASTLSAFARLWFAPTVAASQGNTEFYVHCVGMPQAHLEAPEAIGDALLSANRVSVRDQVTARRLGNRFRVEVDPVFALSTIMQPDEWEAEAFKWVPRGFPIGNYLAAQVSPPYLAAGLEAWCEQVASIAQLHDMPVLLVPICHFLGDRETLENARHILIGLGLAPDKVALAPDGSKDVVSTAAILAMSGGVITSSLHACVTAASFGVPFAGYAGDAKKKGKHHQTLLAAGISYGMAMNISEIATTFAHSREQDCKSSQQIAVNRATEGLELLAHDLVAGSKGAQALSDETITAVLFHDRLPTQDLRFEVKRTILRILERSATLATIVDVGRRLVGRRQTAGVGRVK